MTKTVLNSNPNVTLKTTIAIMTTTTARAFIEVLFEERYIVVKVGKNLFSPASKNKLDHIKNKKYLFTCTFYFLSNPALRYTNYLF